MLHVDAQVVEDLCKEVQKEAQIYRDSIRSEAELLDTTGVDLHRHSMGSHNRPMVVIKAEKIKHAKWGSISLGSLCFINMCLLSLSGCSGLP